jgi:hypothetical protein
VSKRSLKEYYAAAAFPKRPPVRDRGLRAWIARQECVLSRIAREQTGQPLTICALYKVHAAHVPTGTGGMGMKGDDLFVPLCFHHHIDVQHGRGVITFQERYGIDLHAECVRYRDEYRRAA